MTTLIVIGILFTHLLAFLIGKSITENRAVNKAYPEYKALKDMRENVVINTGQVYYPNKTSLCFIEMDGKEYIEFTSQVKECLNKTRF